MRNRWFAPIVIAVSAVCGLLAYPFLPAQMPVHWGMSGQPDRYGGRWEGALLLPIVALLVWAVMLVAPRLDPRRANYSAFQPTYLLFVNATVLVLAAVHLVTLAAGLGWPVDVARVVTAAVGALLVLLGNELGRVRPTFFVGIRTPWTLSDEEVWRRTHRVGGRMFVAAGVLMIVGALVLPLSLLFAVVLLGALGASLGAVLYSYVVWRQRHHSQT